MNLPKLNRPAPFFQGTAIVNNAVVEISSNDFKNKYLILLFFPMDFTYVCPTELVAFSDKLNAFAALNTSIVACATESHFAHLKWLDIPHSEGGIRGIRLPLLADKSMSIARAFGVLNEEEGFAYRAMFIIDDKGILRQITINDHHVGRNVTEADRLIRTIQHAEKLRESTPANGFVEVSPSSIQKPTRVRCFLRPSARDLVE